MCLSVRFDIQILLYFCYSEFWTTLDLHQLNLNGGLNAVWNQMMETYVKTYFVSYARTFGICFCAIWYEKTYDICLLWKNRLWKFMRKRCLVEASLSKWTSVAKTKLRKARFTETYRHAVQRKRNECHWSLNRSLDSFFWIKSETDINEERNNTK